MKIDKEHIEELIFEYYEGNLSDVEKAEVLNFIHQNPEFESTFALWAQTYTLSESIVPDYGIVNPHPMSTAVPWYQPVLVKMGIAASVSLITIVTYWGLHHQTKVLPKPRIYKVQKHTQQDFIESSSSKVAVSTLASEAPVGIKSTQQVAAQAPKVTSNPTLIEVGLVTDKIEKAAPVTQVSEEESKSLTSVLTKADSVANIQEKVTTPVETTQPANLKKKKRSLHLKPTAEFLPTNENF